MAKDQSSEIDYLPITCLNTSYKLFTGILGNYMKENSVKNSLCNKNQMRICINVLETVNQLLIDKCILKEVKEHERNLAVTLWLPEGVRQDAPWLDDEGLHLDGIPREACENNRNHNGKMENQIETK